MEGRLCPSRVGLCGGMSRGSSRPRARAGRAVCPAARGYAEASSGLSVWRQITRTHRTGSSYMERNCFFSQFFNDKRDDETEDQK